MSLAFDSSAATFFAERRTRADFAAFDRLMRRKGGEPPRAEDAKGRLTSSDSVTP